MHRRNVLKTLGTTLLAPNMVGASRLSPSKPNFVFISIDDLNDWISPLSSTQGLGSGYPGIMTPNLQSIADIGANCKAAYAAVPACSPSRTSTLLGVSPDKTGVYFNGQLWSKTAVPEAQTVFSYFRKNGYKTFGVGKLFHGARSLQENEFDYFHQSKSFGCNSQALPYSYDKKDDKGKHKGAHLNFGVSPEDCHWSNKIDEKNVAHALTVIDEQFSQGGCFFGLGLLAPHLPFAAMSDIYEKYKAKKLAYPPGFFPNANRLEGLKNNLRDLEDVPKIARESRVNTKFLRQLDDAAYMDLLVSYLSTITYTDFHIGLVIEKLRSLRVLDNTYIVVWSDHGMHMAEKFSFSKFTLWERSLRVPLLFSGPGIKQTEISSPVSLSDIFPTLCDLANIDTPAWCTGTSLANFVTGRAKAENTSAISIFGRGASNNPDDQRLSRRIATNQWNYIHHADGSKELYDRLRDPHEWYNLYKVDGDNSDIKELVASLDAQLPKLSECQNPVW